jgi:hypothetical protein
MNALASQLRFHFFGTDDAIPAPPLRSPASKLQDGKSITMGTEIFNEENEIKVINEKEEGNAHINSGKNPLPTEVSTPMKQMPMKHQNTPDSEVRCSPRLNMGKTTKKIHDT